MLNSVVEYYISTLFALNQNINSYECYQLLLLTTELQSISLISTFHGIYMLTTNL